MLSNLKKDRFPEITDNQHCFLSAILNPLLPDDKHHCNHIEGTQKNGHFILASKYDHMT